MLRAATCASVLMSASAASAEVILACSFPTIPPVVMRFPDGLDAEKTMEVGGRPAVPLSEGQGSGRLITASVDGYHFRFAPGNSVMDVEREGAAVVSETGSCVTIGGPVQGTPLQIVAAPPEPAETQDAAPSAPLPDAAPGEAVASEDADTGRWTVDQQTSAFDDSRTVVVASDSTNFIPGQFDGPGPARMILRCKENTTSAYLWLNDQFLSDIQGYGRVEYRIDDQKAASVRMSSSTDNKALGLWAGDTAIPFIKALAAGEGVVFRATPFNENPVEFSFDLTGLEAALAPLREACSW